MYPLKNQKWRFFGFNMKLTTYMFRQYQKNFQIPSVGQWGKKMGLFADFPDFFKKISILDTILEIF